MIGSQVGTGFFFLPRLASAHAGQNAWISVLLGALVPLLSLILIERILRTFPSNNAVEVTWKLLGKWSGSLITILLIVYLIFFSSTFVRMFAEMVSIYMLPHTPIGVIIFVIITISLYLVSKGAKIIGRANEALFYVSLLSILLIISTAFTGELTNLLPVGEIDPEGLFKGAINSMYSYAGIEVLLVCYLFTGRKEQVLHSGKIAISVVAITYTAVTLTALLVFGTEYMQGFLWPVINLLKIIEFDVFHRLELFLLATWLGIALTPVYNLALTSNVLLVNLLKLDLLHHYPAVSIIVFIMIYLIANIPQNTGEVFMMANYAGYLSLLGLLVPVLLYMVMLIRGKKVKDD